MLRLTPSTTGQSADERVTLGEGETSELEIRLHTLPVTGYDIFLGRGASEATISAGMPDGHLTTVQLGSFDRPEIEVTVQ